MAGVLTTDSNPPAKGTSIKDLFSLRGRFSILTGAGQGIGFEVARGFAEQGCDIAIWYNSNTEAIKKAEEISQEFGVKCKAYRVGVTNEEEVQKAVDEQVKEFGGKLHVFVANAGIPWTEGPMLSGSSEHYHNVMKVNVDGVFYCARAAGKHFLRQHQEDPSFQGSFIATASMSGHIVNLPQLQAAYNASKAAVIHFCRSLSVEWAGFGRANTVSPGYIVTEISNFCPAETKRQWHERTPMRREGLPAELKGAYLLLASDAGSYMTGSDIIVDGGYCCP